MWYVFAGIPSTSGLASMPLNSMPFIKSEGEKLDFVNQIMNTTQASLNGYFPGSLHNMVSEDLWLVGSVTGRQRDSFHGVVVLITLLSSVVLDTSARSELRLLDIPLSVSHNSTIWNTFYLLLLRQDKKLGNKLHLSNNKSSVKTKRRAAAAGPANDGLLFDMII